MALLEDASGGLIGEEEAAEYAARSLAVLRDLAVSNNRVLSVAEGANILMDVLVDAQELVMLDVAEILSHVDSPNAQTAIFEKALAAEGFEQIEIAGDRRRVRASGSGTIWTPA
jgi:hypothetical protein